MSRIDAAHGPRIKKESAETIISDSSVEGDRRAQGCDHARRVGRHASGRNLDALDGEPSAGPRGLREPGYQVNIRVADDKKGGRAGACAHTARPDSRMAAMNARARFGSTLFHHTPSSLRELATMHPSATAMMDFTLRSSTPLPTITGRLLASYHEGIQIRRQKVVELTKKIQRLTRKGEKVNAAKEFLEKHPQENAYSGSDPDSRLQKDKGMVQPGYKAQSIVEGKNKLIVAADVCNQQTDKRLLGAMVEQAIEVKKGLGIEEKSDMVADAGYFNETDVLANQQEQAIRVTVPIAADGEREGTKEKVFGQEKFCYDQAQETWACPMGRQLRRITLEPVADKNGRLTLKCQANEEECVACPKRSCCTKGNGGRMLRVSVRHAELKEYFEQLDSQERKALIRKRKELVEHPFGTIKRTFGFGHFLQRGLEAVRAEFQFSCFIYDLKRVLNLLPLGTLIAAVSR
jgi:hypothetical protein